MTLIKTICPDCDQCQRCSENRCRQCRDNSYEKKVPELKKGFTYARYLEWQQRKKQKYDQNAGNRF